VKNGDESVPARQISGCRIDPTSTALAMFFPYNDINPTDRTPYVNWTLLALNIAAFVVTLEWLTLPPEARLEAYREYGALVPNDLETVDFFTSMFLHGGIGHLVGNMMFLYITGDNIEDELGPVGYVFFYLGCGVAASAAHLAFVPPDSGTPMLGASGAISGVMGAYIVWFPHSRIQIFYWLWIFIGTAQIRAVWWLGIWIGFQILAGTTTGASGGGVAYAAHIGGFAVGAVLAVVLKSAGVVEGEVEEQLQQRGRY